MHRPVTPPASPRVGYGILAAALLTFALVACGPSYPECNNDEHCASHNQVCVDNLCRDCRDDHQCNRVNACMECTSGFVCRKLANCCQNDLDCPDGRCWKSAGQQTGQCGGQCQSSDHCPAGQRCEGGQCVPDVACSSSADCPEGESCVNGQCVRGSCEIVPVYFDFNEITVRLDQEGIVAANAACLQERVTRHVVEGHCDERGSDEYNLALSQRRAAALVRAYTALGVPSGLLSTIGFGEEKPACVESNENCWQKNRRTETVVP